MMKLNARLEKGFNPEVFEVRLPDVCGGYINRILKYAEL